MKKSDIHFRITEEDKEFIKNKATELGYKTVSAFLVASAKSHFKVQVDMKKKKKINTEINYIGRNINQVARKINTDGYYTDVDLEQIKNYQKQIIALQKKEYKRLQEIGLKMTSETMKKSEKKRLIESFLEAQLPIPKRVLLSDLYENFKDDCLYIYQEILRSKETENEFADYLLETLYQGKIEKLSDEDFIKLSDNVFQFTEKLKRKLINLNLLFVDNDWYEIRDIFRAYELI